MDAPSRYTFVVATQDHPKNADLVSQVNAHVASYTHTRRHLKASEHNFVQSNFGQVRNAAAKSAPEKRVDRAEAKAGRAATLELSNRVKFRFANSPSSSKAVKKRKRASKADDKDAYSDRNDALVQSEHARQGQDAFMSTFATTASPEQRRTSGSQIVISDSPGEEDNGSLQLNPSVGTYSLEDSRYPSSLKSSLRLLESDALSTTLDPFIRLPVEVTQRDRSLLHFFLKEGRLLVLGTSTNDKYCIALNIASKWMQESSVFVLNHVVMAEAQLSSINKTPLSKQFYQRRSQVYSEVRHLMSSPTVSFSLKLIAVIQLVFMEWTLKLPELQSLHGQAVDALIESQGGLMSFLPALEEKHGPTIEPEFYVNIFVITEVPIKDQKGLELSRNRFIATLRRLSNWTQLFQDQKTERSPDGKPQDLTSLTEFLKAPINNTLLSTKAPWPFLAAPFFACLNICLTFLDFDLRPDEIMDFLQRVQHHMIMTANPSAKGGAGIAHHLAHVRTNMLCPVSYKASYKVKHAELRLSQGCVDALKIYSLLSGRSRLKLTQWLCKLCLVVVEDIGPKDLLDEAILKTLASEITSEWWSRQVRDRPQSVASLPNG